MFHLRNTSTDRQLAHNSEQQKYFKCIGTCGANNILLFYYCWLVAKSCLSLATLWAVACQAPLCMNFPRQEYWSGLPFPPPGNLPDPGIESWSPALQADSLPSEPPGKPLSSLLTSYMNMDDNLEELVSILVLKCPSSFAQG